MVRTLADIQAYFRRLVSDSPDLATVLVGDSEEILSIDRSQIVYPVLWLETPTLSWSLDQVGEREYLLYFTILLGTKPENYRHQEYLLHKTLELTNKVLTKLRSDHLDDVLKIDINAQSDPITGYGHDFEYGWRTRLSILSPVTKCYDNDFDPACPVGSWAAFTWSNNSPGGFSDLVLEDVSNYADVSGWTVTWRWKIDNGATQTSSTVPGPDLGAGSYMLLWLELELGDCQLLASAYITSAQSAGESVPYLLSIEYC